MLSLPPIALDDDEGEYCLVLPLPSVEWVRLLAWQTGERTSAELVRLLVENPVLLVYAAISFRTAQARSTQSLVELGEWCRDGISDLLQRHAFSGSTTNATPQADQRPRQRYEYNGSAFFRKPLKKYLRNKGQKRKRNLSQLLSSLVGLPIERSRKLIVVCASELLNELEPQLAYRARNGSRRADSIILERWREGTIDEVAVAKLLNYFRTTAERESQFQERLRQEKLASLQQLAYGASHEINNPLANIATRAQNLLNSEPNPDRRSKLGIIYEQAMRSHEMISDLMLFANPPAIHREQIDLRLFLSRLIRQAETQLDVSTTVPSAAGATGNGYTTENSWMESQTPAKVQSEPLRLIVRISPGVDLLEGDPTQLNVALMALIQNGIESLRCSTRRTLELRVSPMTESVWFEVTDDGRGVSPSIANHLFDPFFSGREAGRGLGFGLSKAWRIAQLHAGDLVFDANHSPGAKFVLKVPLRSRSQ
jgi:signal transduction histidine kinase